MSPDRQRWAEVLKAEEVHGDCAPTLVAERIGALAEERDFDGVERWRQIAARLDQLINPRTVLPG